MTQTGQVDACSVLRAHAFHPRWARSRYLKAKLGVQCSETQWVRQTTKPEWDEYLELVSRWQ